MLNNDSDHRNNRTIGIDPGYDRLGIAVVEMRTIDQRAKEVLIHSECFETDRKAHHSERLRSLGQRVREVIEEFRPDILSIETLFFTANQKTAMKVAEARGVVMYEAARAGIAIFELSPLQVKMSVTGYGKSEKYQVIDMVKKLIKMDEKKRKDDEFDAIAIAIAGSASYPQQSIVLQKR